MNTYHILFQYKDRYVSTETNDAFVSVEPHNGIYEVSFPISTFYGDDELYEVTTFIPIEKKDMFLSMLREKSVSGEAIDLQKEKYSVFIVPRGR